VNVIERAQTEGIEKTRTNGGDSKGELGHGVKSGRARVDQVLNELGDRSSGSPVGGEGGALLLGRDLSGEEEPEESLGKGLGSSGSLGEELLALGDGLSSESDTLVWERETKETRRQSAMSLTEKLRGGSLPASRTEPSRWQGKKRSAQRLVKLRKGFERTLPDHSLKKSESQGSNSSASLSFDWTPSESCSP
jgi:hypothetical protein